ncbi:MAG: glycosyl hydrolase 108 family protein, partial [Rikenellaceae bacterium]
MGLFRRNEEKQLARQERREERREARQNKRNKIGTAFTINDDALVNKIDNIIANNSTSLYSSTMDSSATQGIATKLITDLTAMPFIIPHLSTPQQSLSSVLDTSTIDNVLPKLQTNFANQNKNSNFANIGNDYISPTLSKNKNEDSGYSNKSYGNYTNISPFFTNGLGFNKSNHALTNQHLTASGNQLDRSGIIRDSLINKVVEVEGGYSNLKNDRGGRTNKGIAWDTWQNFAKPTLGIEPTVENQKNLSVEDAKKIYKINYWDKYRIDEINDIDLKHLIFDIFVNNTGSAAKMIQNTLNDDFNCNLEVDGILGSKTINLINSINPDKLHDKLLDKREQHYYNLGNKDPKQKQFIKGWINNRV